MRNGLRRGSSGTAGSTYRLAWLESNAPIFGRIADRRGDHLAAVGRLRAECQVVKQRGKKRGRESDPGFRLVTRLLPSEDDGGRDRGADAPVDEPYPKQAQEEWAATYSEHGDRDHRIQQAHRSRCHRILR